MRNLLPNEFALMNTSPLSTLIADTFLRLYQVVISSSIVLQVSKYFLRVALPLRVVVLLLFTHINSLAQVDSNAPTPQVLQSLDSLANHYASQADFSGVILVANEGKAIYRQAFGLANREWNIPNTVSTKFRTGSVTKPFTAVLVFQAIEKGLLRLEGKVTDYLPDYPAKYGNQITIHHLLSHTGGLIDIPQVPGLEWNKERLGHTRQEMLDYFKSRDLRFKPGTDFHYSNFGYYLLSVILEKVTGQSYEELLSEKIFIPAGMNNSSVAPNREVLSNRANGYFKREGKYFNAPFFDQSVVQGYGDIISTVDDLLAFDQALRTNKLVCSASQRVMYTPTLPQKNNYAYGWFVQLPGSEQGPAWVRHSGSINGFSAVLVRLVSQNQTIILLGNTHGIPTIEISDKIKKIL
jgi:CubicO group peptidase (beta-lactamase class C family)